MADVGAYLTLKLARDLFRKSPEGLEPDERRRVARVAAHQRELETLILSTPEAASVTLPESSVESSLAEIRTRYESEGEYHADLQRIGLAAASLRREIERDLTVEAVLERIGSRAAKVSDTDVEIFYFMHKERFVRPETRTLRHILITINDALPGSERGAALAKIEAIRSRLLKDAKRFEEQALKHSECPTAMNGGLLGAMPKGQLYAELEPVAFALAVGQLSAVAESPLGLHILRCDAVTPQRQATLNEVRPRIHDHLADQRRKICQKSWINGLKRSA
ncbi:MAG: nitrogen fixation protein NifM [Rhodocyclaceae bacterium]|nr:nitrogen fixation protein NifM [Rhodocyclaceae bacterium]